MKNKKKINIEYIKDENFEIINLDGDKIIHWIKPHIYIIKYKKQKPLLYFPNSESQPDKEMF